MTHGPPNHLGSAWSTSVSTIAHEVETLNERIYSQVEMSMVMAPPQKKELDKHPVDMDEVSKRITKTSEDLDRMNSRLLERQGELKRKHKILFSHFSTE